MSVVKFKDTDGNWKVHPAVMNKYGTLVDNYSEDEIVVGKWIDGRPLYRKTVKINTVQNATVIDLGFDVSCKLIKGVCNNFKRSSGDRTTPFANGNEKYQFPIWQSGVNGGRMYLYSLLNETVYDVVLVINYTKTTDAENSFDPSMVIEYQNNVYKETETICGQWIDGRPIYRRVIKTISAGGNWDKIAEIQEADGILSVDGFIKTESGNCPLNSTYRNYARSYTEVNYTNCIYQEVNMTDWQYKQCFLIIEYTKTTDL